VPLDLCSFGFYQGCRVEVEGVEGFAGSRNRIKHVAGVRESELQLKKCSNLTYFFSKNVMQELMIPRPQYKSIFTRFCSTLDSFDPTNFQILILKLILILKFFKFLDILISCQTRAGARTRSWGVLVEPEVGASPRSEGAREPAPFLLLTIHITNCHVFKRGGWKALLTRIDLS